MGERKVLNKYIPADFDPLLVPRSKKPKDDLVTVRMMLPFSIQCSTCSSFLYRGRKFNSKKEAVKGIEGKYLGIQRFRFYIKCSDCARPITFLTDPQKADYEMESGGTRNYEVWHDETKVNAENERSVEEEEKLDSMKALENRVAESQREMAEMDALEEIRAMNERHSRLMKGGGRKVDVAEAVLKAREVAMGGGGGKKNGGVAEELLDLNENGLTKDEEDLVQSIKFGAVVGAGSTDQAAVEIHRLDEHDELMAEKRRQEEAAAIMNKQKQRDEEDKKASNATTVPVFKVKRKKKKISSSDTVTNSTILPEAKRTKVEEEKKAESNPPPEPAGLSGLLGGYGSDSD
mmetsp:Transcript_37001/g.75437  ORF Transcript_37001/g.75437 Transcript_37001/m.75437 type:complete len:347 (+) Transcript_37001:93-1133(+)